MQDRVSRSRWRPVVAAAVLLAALAFSPSARAFPPPGEGCRDPSCKATCPEGQDIFRIETRHCGAIRGKREGFDVERACCRNHSGHVNCRQWPQCPERSRD